MRVRAIADGFIYGSYRRPGDEFDLKDKALFSKKWMQVVDDSSDPYVVEPEQPYLPKNAVAEHEYMKKVQNSPPPSLLELEKGAPKIAESPAISESVEEPEQEGPPTGDQFRI